MAKGDGFIVHPFETGDRKYHASYGNANKTTKSFKNLRQAKAYIASHGVKKAIYDSPSGTKRVNTTISSKRSSRPKKRSSNSFGLLNLKPPRFF